MARTVKPYGPFEADFVVVGDAPAVEDYEAGTAFAGRTGDVVMSVLAQCGIDPTKVLFINAVSYRKYSGAMTPGEITEDARTHLIPTINQHPRKAVLALGNTAVFAVGASDKPQGVNALRGRRLESELIVSPIVASIHPYFILKDPDEINDFFKDVKYASRIYTGDFKDQIGTKIIDLDTPASVELMRLDCVDGFPYLAYDWETTDVNRDTAQAVTCAFANGRKEKDDYLSYFWGGYDKMQPRYEAHVLKQFKEAFDHLFSEAGKADAGFKLIGYNVAFDDWISERHIGHSIKGSDFDGMWMKWVVDNGGYHGLKEAVARFLGYPDYEAGAYEYFREVKTRRGRILQNQEDIDLLKQLGVEPEVSARGGLKWPKELDKGLCGYALIPYDILRQYNVLDSVYTWLLFNYFAGIIKRDKLGRSYKLRHNSGKELLRAEQRGLLLDEEVNQAWSAELKEIVEACKPQIQEAVTQIAIDRGMPEESVADFKPSSPQQLGALLYGEPLDLFTINPNICGSDNFRDRKAFKQLVEKFEKRFFNFQKINAAIAENAFDKGHCATAMEEAFYTKHPEYRGKKYYDPATLEEVYIPILLPKKYYPNGLYTPKAFTATGAPSCAGAVLQNLYLEKEHDLLKLVLMERKASKLKSTFVDAIYKARDKNGVVHGRYNTIGTRTGRISSSNPNCFDPATEILTEKGWQRFDRLEKGIRVMQYDNTTLEMSFVHPTEYFERDFAGELHHIHSQQFELMVTPEHRLLMSNRKDGRGLRKDVLAKDFKADYVMYHASMKVADDTTTLVSKYLVQYAVALQADGTFVKDGGVAFGFTKARKAARLQEILKNLDVPYSYREGTKNGKKHFQIYVGKHAVPLTTLVDADKKFTTDVLKLSPNNLYVFEQEVWKWDGSEDRRTMYASAHKSNADIVQAVCLMVSRRARVRPYTQPNGNVSWQVDATDTVCSGTTNVVVDKVPYTGKVYCLSVPSTYVLVRREGEDGRTKAVIAGQCQNFPKYARGQFIPRPGYVFVEFDLSQAEVRAIAAYSRDENLMEAVREGDIHTAIGCKVFKKDKITDEERRYSKTIVFGIIYGMQAGSLAVAMDVDEEQAQEFINMFYDSFPKVKIWLDEQVRVAGLSDKERKKEGIEGPAYYVQTPWGTRCSTRGLLSIENSIRQHTARQAMNMPIQGAAGELTLYYIVEIMKKVRENNWDIWLVNTTHDSVTLEVPKELAWRSNERYVENDKGEKKLKYDCSGPVVDAIKEVIDMPVSVAPLDRVKFKADIEINYHWSAVPNLKKSLDPRENLFDWALIKGDTSQLDKEEKQELAEIA